VVKFGGSVLRLCAEPPCWAGIPRLPPRASGRWGPQLGSPGREPL